MQFLIGVPDTSLEDAALLYEEVFGSKLQAAIPERTARIRVLRRSLVSDRAVCALEGSALVGLAGFYFEGASFTGGMTFGSLRQHLGLGRAVKAAIILSAMERSPQPEELLMDGLVVAEPHRGRGIGSRLLEELVTFGREHGFSRIRLDVIDTNVRARDLYLRLGFVEARRSTYPYLKPLLGFGGSIEMHLTLS